MKPRRLQTNSRNRNSRATGAGKLNLAARLSLLLLLLCSLSGALFADPIAVGSQTFNWTGAALPGSKIRITAKAPPKAGDNKPQVIDFTIDVSGLTKTQAANNILEQLKDGYGAKASINEGNSINVYEINGMPITKIDGGGYGISLGGTVDTQYVLPGAKWVAYFSPNFDQNQGVTAGGTLVFDVANQTALSAYLPTGTQPSDAAQTFDQMLTGAGYAGVQLNGTEVSFYTDGSNNPIGSIADFSFDGDNLHLGLGLPATVPEPSSLLLVGSGLTAACGLLRKRLRR